MNEKEAQREVELVLQRYRDYLLIYPKEKHPLIREHHKFEFSQAFVEEDETENDNGFKKFMIHFVAAFNRLPQGDRHLLSYKYLRMEHRNNYKGRGSCTSYRAAAETGLSVSGFYSRRKIALANLALSLGIQKMEVF